jgi:hypothetical protein
MLEMRLGPHHALVGRPRGKGLFGRAAESEPVRVVISPIAARPIRVTGRVSGSAGDISCRSTTRNGGACARASDTVRRPPPPGSVAVSATSWTADENLDLLLEGLRRYDAARLDSGDRLPSLAVSSPEAVPEARIRGARRRNDGARRDSDRLDRADSTPRVIAAADLGSAATSRRAGPS